MTDADLLRGAQRGDAEAWRSLYRRYLPYVWRQAYALVSNIHTAEDVASETMVALLRKLGELDADAGQLAAWLRTVVHRKAVDHHRQAFRMRDRLSAAADMRGANTDPDCAIEADPGQRLETEETCAQVHAALDSLPSRQRLMLEWKYVDNLSVRDIAARLGETEKAVETVLYRARLEFRRLYETACSNKVTARQVGEQNQLGEQNADRA